MMGLFPSFLYHEARFIQGVQYYCMDYDYVFMTISKISDPAYAMSILFPVAASVNTPLGADLLVVTLMAEYLNTLLKWFLMEDRPYWWVRQQNISSIQLRQTPFTCETGPGSPSGHVMGAAAILYALMRWAIANFINNNARIKYREKKTFRCGLWLLLLLALVFVSWSRILVATHFPHQCILGGVLGVGVGYVLTDRGPWCIRDRWTSASRKYMFLIFLVLIAVSAIAFFLQLALSIDPQWSILMAFRWCQRKEYIHYSTTPLFSLVRVCGAALGLALASPVILRKDVKFYPVIGVALVIMMVVPLQYLKDFISTDNTLIFFLCQFLIFVAMPFLLLFVVPLVASLYKVKED